MAKTVVRRAKKNAQPKVKILFDVPTLNSLIKYIRCEYVGAMKMQTLYKMIQSLDLESYIYQTDVYNRLRTLKLLLKFMVEDGIRDENLLESAVFDEFPDSRQIITDLGFQPNQLNSSECEYLTKAIDARMEALAVYEVREDMIKILNDLDGSAFDTSYFALVRKFKDMMSELMMKLQDNGVNQGLLREFSFSDENAAQMIDAIVRKAKRPSSILQTGIRQLNAILNPGFQSSRLYTIVGGSGKFKSGTLLNLADQIRRYNPQILPYENGMRKTILFITLENSIEESVERLFDMYSDVNDDLRAMDSKDVIGILREKGKFDVNTNTGIDITFVYRGNLEISTADIFGIVRDLNEKGKEPICIFLDYIKRIESAHPSMGDERVRMSYVAKELKSIAQFYEIPVITAMQLNRDGNGIIDAAMRESKQDVARFVGSSSIGNSWDIIEDSDWVCLINLEMQKSTNQLFLTFKRLKMRGKKSVDNTIDYFNHPFTNEKNIRLMPDVDLESPVSIISLATDLESIDEQNELKSARKEKMPASKVATETKSAKILSAIKAIQLDGLVA